MEYDKNAIRILTDTYWTKSGWRREPATSSEELAYAKSRGVMFDPIQLSHDQAVQTALAARNAISKSEVSDAFVASLGSRRLDLRSGLGSYAVARHLRDHRMAGGYGADLCGYCGGYDSTETIDLSILNFERIKWGGVRHDKPYFIGFDLQTLRKTQRPEPQPRDFEILKSIIDIADSMPSSARLSDLDQALANALPSNSAERRILIGILGYAGILVDPSRPEFRQEFVPAKDREWRPWYKNDWPYPVQWWTGANRVQPEAVADWFPRLQSMS